MELCGSDGCKDKTGHAGKTGDAGETGEFSLFVIFLRRGCGYEGALRMRRILPWNSKNTLISVGFLRTQINIIILGDEI